MAAEMRDIARGESRTLVVEEERVRRYLFFPGTEWRIVKTDGWQGAIGE